MALKWADTAFAGAVDVPPHLPLLHWRDNRLCEPVFAYFAWSADTGRVGVSSMRPEAFILRQWFAWMAGRGRPWHEPDDEMLGSWRDEQLRGANGKPLDAAYVQRKIGIVHAMYAALPEALGPMAATMSCDRCVAAPAEAPTPGERRLSSREGPGGVVWKHAEGLAKDPAIPVVMDRADVARVLARLRTVPAGASDRELAIADRNWLVGRMAAHGGARAAETSGVDLEHLAAMLRRNRIVVPPSPDPSVHPLDALSDDVEGRGAALAALDALDRSGRSTMRLMVWGKGRGGRKKRRPAAVSVDLVRDILVVGVWSVRRTLLARCRAEDGSGNASTALFISSRTHRGLSPGSIGDILKDACNAEPRIDGSGHRFRAFYCVELGVRFLKDCLVLGGGRMTPEVEGRALAMLAEAMGHKSSGTTLRYYFDLAKALLLQGSDATAEAVLRPFWTLALGAAAPGPTEADVALIARLVRALARCGDGERLRAVVAAATAREDLRRAA